MADALGVRLAHAFGFNGASGPGTLGNFSLDASTDALEFMFQAREAATLTRIGVRLGAITGTTPTYRVSLQGIGSTGNPDGTVKGGGSPASKTFSPTSLGWSAGSWNWLTLDNSYACTRGEWLAAVIDYSSGTVDGSNFASFTSTLSNAHPTGSCPWVIQNNAGSRSKQTAFPIFGYGSSGTAYGNPLLNNSFVGDGSGRVTSGENPDEYVLKFTIPSGWCDTYKIAGIRMGGYGAASGSTAVVSLYSGSDTTAANSTGATTENTVQQTITWDTDYSGLGSEAGGTITILFTDTTLVTLYAGATYRVGIRAAGNRIYMQQYNWDAAADMDAYTFGQNFGASSREAGSGNFTDIAKARMAIELILSDITEPAGGGGTTIAGTPMLRGMV